MNIRIFVSKQLSAAMCLKRKEVVLKYSELERLLKKAGCELVRDDGRHLTWYSPKTGKYFQTSHHKSEEVKSGTLKSIKRDAGIA